MPKNTVNTIPTKTRLMVCDWLMDDVAYDEIRRRLGEWGMPEDEQPSDFCLRKYKDGHEFQEQYQARLVAHRLAHWDLPELDPNRDWQQAAADYAAARMTMMLSTTANIPIDTLIRLSRTLMARESIAFRRDVWSSEQADKHETQRQEKIAEHERLREKGMLAYEAWDSPGGLTPMDVARTLDRLETMLVDAPAAAAGLGLSAQMLLRLRGHHRIPSTSELILDWDAQVDAGYVSPTSRDHFMSLTGSGPDYEATCLAILLAEYRAEYGDPTPATEPDRSAQKATAPQTDRIAKADPCPPDAVIEPVETSETAADRHEIVQNPTETHRSAQTPTTGHTQPVFANSPSAKSRQKARQKRKKAKR